MTIDNKDITLVILVTFGLFLFSFLIGARVTDKMNIELAIKNGAGYMDPIKQEFVWIKREPVKVELKVTPSNEEK